MSSPGSLSDAGLIAPQVLGVQSTIGAMLAGAMVAIALSAILAVQVFLYFRIFPGDKIRYKLLVLWLWLLDATHSCVVCAAVWFYMVTNFTNPESASTLNITVALNIALNSTTAASATAFYLWRIHRLSKHNWLLTGLIAALSFARVGLAYTTSVVMVQTRERVVFGSQVHTRALLTSTLVVAASVDIIVSFARYYYLHRIRRGYTMAHDAVDAVFVFTLNDGLLQSVVILAACVLFLVLPRTLIGMAVTFTINKCAANSVLATLNLRNWYRHHRVEAQPTMAISVEMKKRRSRRHLVDEPQSPSHKTPSSPGGFPFKGVGAPSLVGSMQKSSGVADSVSSGDVPGITRNVKVEVLVEHRVNYVEDLSSDPESENRNSMSKGLAV